LTAPSVRAPAVAGKFYPGAKDALQREVRGLLHAAEPAGPEAPARGAVVPHAGYVYSGLTAAHVFRRVTLPKVIVVLAPNHTGVCDAPQGASLWARGAFHTPLGDVPVAEAFAAELLDSCPLVGVDHTAHEQEHAVEVELPFLQERAPEARIVPLILAWDTWEMCETLGLALADLVRRWAEPVFLLASSDLNHYEAATVSEEKDARAISALQAVDGKELLKRCRRERISMCGRGPAAVTLVATRALGATRGELVDYRHSGWVTNDESRVVGYAGVVIP